METFDDRLAEAHEAGAEVVGIAADPGLEPDYDAVLRPRPTSDSSS